MMSGNDAYLFDAGWLFFAGWSLVLVALSLIAFGEDLIPSPARNRSTEEQY
jgi:hypothetical protein